MVKGPNCLQIEYPFLYLMKVKTLDSNMVISLSSLCPTHFLHQIKIKITTARKKIYEK